MSTFSYTTNYFENLYQNNRIENAIFNALKASQYLTEHSSDLNDLISLTDNL